MTKEQRVASTIVGLVQIVLDMKIPPMVRDILEDVVQEAESLIPHPAEPPQPARAA